MEGVILKTDIYQYHGNMEANARFEEVEVVNYAQAHNWKIILLFEISLTNDCTAFRHYFSC